MSIISTLVNYFMDAVEYRAAVLTYQHLRSIDTVTLRRAGISPQLLAQGVGAYPWRDTVSDKLNASASALNGEKSRTATVVHQIDIHKDSEIRQGIAELMAYSDAELDDLGIARVDIEQVVRHGRAAIEGTDAEVRQPRAA